MSGKQTMLPRLVLEDYLSLLRGLVILAWIGVVAGIATELSIRSSAQFAWPGTGTFSLIYNAILVVFLLNTLVLTVLLVYRDWYERVPRKSAPRVRWLLIAVMAWLALLVLCAFHVTGAMHGPFMLLLPVMLIAALVVLPGSFGWWTAGALLAGHVLVLVLETTAVINPGGALAPHFSYMPGLTPWGGATLLMILLAALLLAMRLRAWLYPDGQNLGPAQRIDLDTGLFRRAFLDHRLVMELGRIKRQGGSAALLLIGLDEEPSVMEMRTVAGTLTANIRLESDTPAIYAPGVLAVLLPAAETGGAESAAKRIVSRLSAADVNARFRSAAAVASNSGIQPEQWVASAEASLQRAVTGDEPVVTSE